MPILQVTDFNLFPKDFVRVDDLNPIFEDREARPWAASLLSSSSFSYLKELDDFLTAFSKDAVNALLNPKYLQELLQAYARIISGLKYPLYGQPLIELVKYPPMTYREFAKRLWKTYFNQGLDEAKLQEALEVLDAGHSIQAFSRVFNVDANDLDPDFQLLELIAKLLAVRRKRERSISLSDLFKITQKRLDILPVFLGKIILAVDQKDPAQVVKAMQEAHEELTLLAFKKDFPRNGVEFEDAQGGRVIYFFEMNYERHAQRMEDERQAYTDLIGQFLKKQGLSQEQINFLASTFHQSAWHSLFYDQFIRQHPATDWVLPQLATGLRIRKNGQNQPVGAATRIRLQLKSSDDSGKAPAPMGLLSVEAVFPDEKREEKDIQPALILPGRARHLHEGIRINYRALSPQGHLRFPEGFSPQIVAVDDMTIKKRIQNCLNEMANLALPLNEAKEALAKANAESKKIKLLSGDVVASALKNSVLEARKNIHQARRAGRIKTGVLTFLTAVAVTTLITLLFISGVITGGLAFAGILGGSLLVSNLPVYVMGRRAAQIKTQKRVEAETRRINQEEQILQERHRKRQRNLTTLEKRHEYLRQEQKILEHTRLTKVLETNLLEQKSAEGLEEKYSQTPSLEGSPFNDSSTRVVSITNKGRIIDYSLHDLRTLVVCLNERLEGKPNPSLLTGSYHVLGGRLAEMLSERSGLNALLRFYASNKLNPKTVIDLATIYGSEDQLKQLKKVRIYPGTDSFLARPRIAMKTEKNDPREAKVAALKRKNSWPR